MGIYAVTAVERAPQDYLGASADAIRSALVAVQVPRGRWVGPAPRITRRINTGSAFEAWITQVTWLMDVDEVTFAPGLRANIAEQVASQLAHVSAAWTAPEVTTYSEALNGPLAWWRSGDAARTRTALAFPTLGGRLDPDENPIGPDSRSTRPSTVGEGVNDWVNRASGGFSIGGLLLIGGGLLALLYFGPALGNLATRATARSDRPARQLAPSTRPSRRASRR